MNIGRAFGSSVSLLLFAVVSCGTPGPQESFGESAAAVTVVQTCTAQNVAGYPYSGTVCGGSVEDTCTPGEIYSCSGGPRGTQNNCTLSQTCNPGCLTGTRSTPVTVNTSSPRASDACFAGAAPLTLSSSSIVGGDNVTLTATLQATHNPYAIVNLKALGTLIAQPCVVPIDLPSTSTSIDVPLPTAVVASQSQAAPWTLISYTDASAGVTRNLVSVPQSLTVNAGGSTVVPPLASFSVTDANGNPVTTITGGTNAFTQGTLSSVAPFGGVNVTVTSSPASAFTTSGNFSVPAGCTSSTQQQTGGILTATSSATSNVSVTLTASDGAGSPLTEGVTVTPPPLAIQSVTLNPSAVTGGSSSSATVALNRAVLSSDPSSTVTVRVSQGLLSGTQLATFSGCTGSPVCTGPLTVPVGSSGTSVSITTSTVSTQDQVTISADASWSRQSASANLTISP